MTHRRETRGQVAVVVPAAGEGKRLGGSRKQFRDLGGKPVLLQTLSAFDQHPDIGRIVIAVPEDQVGRTEILCGNAGLMMPLSIVAGGSSRQASVRLALDTLTDNESVVLVHDAVRPFIRTSGISTIIEAVHSSGAAALAIPTIDTLRIFDRGRFGNTVDRTSLYRMQTPQGFRKDWLVKAHRWAEKNHITTTDDVDLIQLMGYEVEVIEGSTWNIKITTVEDWEIASALWPVWIQNRFRQEGSPNE